MDASFDTYKKRLETLYDDIVMHVVYNYFELKVLDTTSLLELKIFLDKHKHKLFHKHKPTPNCCECNSPPPSSSKAELGIEQFQLLFSKTGQVHPLHEIKVGNHIKQCCLCEYEPNSATEIFDLDITMITLISILIKTCCTGTTLAGKPEWLENIRQIRNWMCHLGEESRVPKETFEQKRTMLETSTLDLSGVISKSYNREIQKKIDMLHLQFQKTDELVATITTMCNANLEKGIRQALHQLDVKVENLSFCLEQASFNKTPSLTEENAISIGAQISEEHKESGNEQCIVIWKFKAGAWDVEDVKKKLAHVSALLEFKIVFVFEGSLVVKTMAPCSLLFEAEKFLVSMDAFVKKLVEICNIDVSKENLLNFDVGIYYLPVPDRDDYQKVCNLCKEKDDKIDQQEREILDVNSKLNRQLTRSYSQLSLDIDRLSISKTMYVDPNIDEPLDNLIMNYTKEIEMDKDKDTQIKDTGTEDTGTTRNLNNEKPHQTQNEYIDEKKDVKSTNKEKLHTQIQQSNLMKQFIKKDVIEILIPFEKPLLLMKVAVSKTGELFACDISNGAVLMYNFEEKNSFSYYMFSSVPWDIAICYDSDISLTALFEDESNETTNIIVTLPSEDQYQYLYADHNTIVPGKSVDVGDACYAVNVTANTIVLSSRNFILIYNRFDDLLGQIQIDSPFLRMLIYQHDIEDNWTNVEESLEHLLFSKDVENYEPSFESPEVDLITVNENEPLIKIDSATSIKLHGLETHLHNSKHQQLRITNQENEYIKVNDVAIDKKNRMYLLSSTDICAYSLDTDKYFTQVLGFPELQDPTALCFDENCQNLYVANKSGREIIVFGNTDA